MTDLEMTRLAAEAIGLDVYVDAYGDLCLPNVDHDGDNYHYWPLHDDAQAMALVKKFYLDIECYATSSMWTVLFDDLRSVYKVGPLPDLNRAIVECVANMMAAKRAKAGA